MACRKLIHSSGVINTADKIAGMKKLPVLLLLFPLWAHAGWKLFDFKSDEDEEAPAWVESETVFPAYPKPENLVLFEVSPVTRNRHFIDASSVSVGKDNVVRYTVVIEAGGGASNVSLEGMRCGAGERRIYAYGHPDKTWSRSRNEAWRAINFDSVFSYQKVLYEDYFCPEGTQVRNASEAVQRLRQSAR